MTTKDEALRAAREALAWCVKPAGGCDDEKAIASALSRINAPVPQDVLMQALHDPENQPSQFGTVPAGYLAALRAENERLRKALTPFANFGGLFDAGEITGASDTDELLLAFDDDRSPRLEKFTVGEFRTAAAALNEGGDHDR